MSETLPAKDLIEFYFRWSEFRPYLVRLRDSKDLEEMEKDILNWVIILTDRISIEDVPMENGQGNAEH